MPIDADRCLSNHLQADTVRVVERVHGSARRGDAEMAPTAKLPSISAPVGRPRSRVAVLVAVLVLVVAAVACRPIPLGSAGETMGNQIDVADCPQFQPSSTAPCGPQPLFWAAIQGPYERFENGDPFTTKCARGTASPTAATCSAGPHAGGATNALYDPTGYEFAIDVPAEDVGRTLSFQIWDAGQYPRSTGTPGTNRTISVARTAGSTVLDRSSGTATFSNADVGEAITGTGIPVGTVITSFVSATRVAISSPAESSGTGTTSITNNPDCHTGLAPFNVQPYLQLMSSQTCQTGESASLGPAPLQVQVFDNDGDQLRVGYESPIPACHIYVPPVSDAGQYRNTWATVCSFTPTQEGIHPVRVKTSAITLPGGAVVPDTGNGWNGFALRVQGGVASRLYALETQSILANTPGQPSVYLAEIGADSAGKTLVIDLFDVGDGIGSGAERGVRIAGPPGGGTGIVPTSGSTIPAAGIADSCRYNAAPAATPGPDVAGAGGTDAVSCRVVTNSNGVSRYNDGWLRIQIGIADDYSCDVDCWWTLRYDSSQGSIPTDRVVWEVAVLDDPTPSPTTTVPEPTPTTTQPVPLGSPRNPGDWSPSSQA